MMKFSTNHPNKFSMPSVAFSIGLMQFIGGFLCEISCILFLSTQNATIDVIIKFVALAKIAQIDNFYWGALPNDNKLKRNINKSCLVTTKYRRQYDVLETRSCWIQFLGVITKCIRIVYASALFYFIPFAILFIPYFFVKTEIPEREFYHDANGLVVETYCLPGFYKF